MRDGAEIVLKIGVPENKELLTEMAALRLCNGKGMVRLIDAAPQQGVFLLERILPGVPLTGQPDDAVATLIAAQTMRKICLGVPEQHSFPSVAKWFEELRRL